MKLKQPKTVRGVRLYHCPQLSAFIRPEQCKANRAELEPGDTAEAVPRREGIQALCASCPGVEVLWERSRSI